MIRRPPRSTRTDTLFPYTTLFRSHQGESDGSIMASASGSSGFMFRLNGGSYQPSSTFGSLAAGTYTITVKDKDDCTISQDFTVDELSPATVSYSARLKPIIETVCRNCHKQAGQPGFPHRLEERRVGKECVITCRSRGSPNN